MAIEISNVELEPEESVPEDNSFIGLLIVTMLVLMAFCSGLYWLTRGSNFDFTDKDIDKVGSGKEELASTILPIAHCTEKDVGYKNCKSACSSNNACECDEANQCVCLDININSRCKDYTNIPMKKVSDHFPGGYLIVPSHEYNCEYFFVSNRGKEQKWASSTAEIIFIITNLDNHEFRVNLEARENVDYDNAGQEGNIAYHVKITGRKFEYNDRRKDGDWNSAMFTPQLIDDSSRKYRLLLRFTADSVVSLLDGGQQLNEFKYRTPVDGANVLYIFPQTHCTLERVIVNWSDPLLCMKNT